MNTDTVSDTDEGAQRKLAQLQSLLIPGETIEAWAIQRRLFALNRRRLIIIATSGRFIGVQRRILGGFRPWDVRWQDLKDVSLYVGTFAADITLTAYDSSDRAVSATGGKVLAFKGLRKDQAQSVYRVCQANEQQWREKRRIRELEELRAQSGGVQISNAPLTGAAGDAARAEDSARRLQQARQLLDARLISDSEYEAIKARIINTV